VVGKILTSPYLSICRNLQMEYVDLYLIHWPMAVKPSKPHFPMKREDIVPMDLSGVWQAMEECHQLDLAKMIGVSNFTTKKLQELLSIAKIPPAVNQVCINRLTNHGWCCGTGKNGSVRRNESATQPPTGCSDL
jgi:diketogulonate reductase-like aldo/keto reductase